MTIGEASTGGAARLVDRVVDGVDRRFEVTGRVGPSNDAVVAYHGVGDEAAYGNVSVERFRRDLRYLTDRFEVVDLPVLLDPGDEPRVAITIDDGYRGALRNAVPVLHEFEVPATVFVCPGFLDGEHSQIPDRLSSRQTLSSRTGIVPGDGSDDRLLDADGVSRLVADDLVTVGNHTLTHVDLRAAESRTVVRRQIRGAKRRLEERFGVDVTRFSYPYGRVSPAPLAEVRRTHDLAVTTRPCLVESATNAARIPRFPAHVPRRRLRRYLAGVHWPPHAVVTG
jgi:peptidoglycan/xylan/chitin deacetylase (PgdA/CDA1 family)